MEISRREANRLERRAAIIAVARNYFFEHGYGATTMSAIAAELGGSKGTLWSYFSSKEELFAAVIEDAASGIQAGLYFPEPADDPLETLTVFCRRFIESAMSPVALSMLRLINGEGARFPEVGLMFATRGPGITRRLVAEYLRDKFGAFLRETDYMLAGQVLVSLCTAGNYFDRLWGMIPSVSNTQKDIDAARAAELFLRAYGRSAVVKRVDVAMKQLEPAT